MTAADSPAAEPKNAANAGTKSPVDSPCRYSSGSTSATLGLLRHQGGKITERNRIRSPVTRSVRRSSTRGARTVTAPGRGRDLPLAGVAVAHHQPPATLVPLGRVRGEIRVDLGLQGGGQHPPGALAHDRVQVQAQLVLGLGIGDYTQHAAFLPRRRSPRRRFQDLSSGKVRRAPISRPNPQLQVIPLRRRRGSAVGERWTWVAWSMLAVFIVSVVFATILAVADDSFQQDPAGFGLFVLGFGAFMVVGALVVAHRHRNPIGWMFSAIALLAFTGGVAGEYATYALVTRPGSLPGAVLAAWYASWPWYPTLALALVFTPLLFPTGRLLSPRWRPVAWLAGAASAAFTVLAALQAELDLEPVRITSRGQAEGSGG